MPKKHAGPRKQQPGLNFAPQILFQASDQCLGTEENQADNLAPISSFPGKIWQHFQRELQHKHQVCEAAAKEPHATAFTDVLTPSQSTAGRRTLGERSRDVHTPLAHFSLKRRESLTPAAETWLTIQGYIPQKRLSSKMPSFGSNVKCFLVY